MIGDGFDQNKVLAATAHEDGGPPTRAPVRREKLHAVRIRLGIACAEEFVAANLLS